MLFERNTFVPEKCNPSTYYMVCDEHSDNGRGLNGLTLLSMTNNA